MAIKKFEPKLKLFLNKEGKNLISVYKRFLSVGKGILNDSSPTKKSGKGKWLIDTGETKEKGFAHKATNISLTVYALNKKHSGRDSRGYKKKNPPTYAQIFNWHNQSQGWSGIFGNKLPVGSEFPRRLVTEVGRQVFRWVDKNIKRKNIKIG